MFLQCVYCHKEFTPEHDYMVKDSVWELTGLPKRWPNRKGSEGPFLVLHMECLEGLLGRPLVPEDYFRTNQQMRSFWGR